MITFKEYLLAKLSEEAPANSVGTSSGISPPAAPNPTCTNIPTKFQKKVLTRKGKK